MTHFIQNKRRILVVFADIVMLCIGFTIAVYLKHDSIVLDTLKLSLFPLVFSHLISALLFRLYRGIWTYASIHDLITVVKTISFTTFLFITWLFFRSDLNEVGRAIVIMNALLMMSLIGFNRFALRLYREIVIGFFRRGKPILIVGAGSAAEMILRDMQKNPNFSQKAVGLVDDNPNKIGSTLNGVPVLGRISDIPQIVQAKEISEIIIAIPSAPGAKIQEIVEICNLVGKPYFTVPGLREMISGRFGIEQIRPVKLEDLLVRQPVEFNLETTGKMLAGKRIMITGAAGSIGSELARQLCRYLPEKLIFVDISENGLFELSNEMNGNKVAFESVICDVSRLDRIRNVMRKHQPHLIFHAAAYKHVPMMEENPSEAISNNVGGIIAMCQASVEFGIEHFLYISTDKAVNPTSVMGASKRIGELVIRQFSEEGKTCFSAVRFGNVLGSSGSVIPLFQKQIAEGGPVTVTHPDVSRFFMTIPEAVSLVIESISLGNSGSLFILDMGEPVKIFDAAKHLIRLSGKNENEIEIKFTGLRSGEKLEEELWTKDEKVEKTIHPQIFQTTIKTNGLSYSELTDELFRSAGDGDEQMIRATLKKYFPNILEQS